MKTEHVSLRLLNFDHPCFRIPLLKFIENCRLALELFHYQSRAGHLPLSLHRDHKSVPKVGHWYFCHIRYFQQKQGSAQVSQTQRGCWALGCQAVTGTWTCSWEIQCLHGNDPDESQAEIKCWVGFFSQMDLTKVMTISLLFLRLSTN